MDIRKIKKLIELIQQTGIAEIEIREGEESVRITREVTKATPVFAQQPIMAAPPPPEVKTAEPSKEPDPATRQDKHMVKAPMVGTVYLSPTPGAKPFVEIGQTVKAGDVLCLIEAMKMLNQIEADKAGVVSSRLIDNGTPVEFNQPLFTIE